MASGLWPRPLSMVSRCIQQTFYASQCERCHKSPQGVTPFHGGVDLETFLAELHYADTPEAAATIAAYLKGLERKRPTHRRKTEHGDKANPSQAAPSRLITTNADSSENDPVKRTLKWLFGGANP
jgi:hypothetical protein